MQKIKVFNTGPSEVVYDREGHVLDASAWGFVDESDPITAGLLISRRLRRAPAPSRAPRTKTTTANGEN